MYYYYMQTEVFTNQEGQNGNMKKETDRPDLTERSENLNGGIERIGEEVVM